MDPLVSYIFLVFGFSQPLYWLYRPEITSCIFSGLRICIDIGSYNVNHEKQNLPFWQNAFSVFGIFLGSALRLLDVL